MKENVNWEKIGVYLAIAATFLTVIVYIADMKERIAKLEVKVDHLENRTHDLVDDLKTQGVIPGYNVTR